MNGPGILILSRSSSVVFSHRKIPAVQYPYRLATSHREHRRSGRKKRIMGHRYIFSRLAVKKISTILVMFFHM